MALALASAATGYAAPEPPDASGEASGQSSNAQLLERGERRRYAGGDLEHIAMPMGGIGAGQVYLTGRGQLDSWQILNNFNSNAHAPGSLFAVWVKDRANNVHAKLLQEGGYGSVPAIPAVEFAGEYPFAWVDYQDDSLPVRVSLETWSPFIPLNTKDSALPAVLFTFTLRNTTSAPLEAALMASAPNLIGWDGYEALEDGRHPHYLGNQNVLAAGDKAQVLRMRTGLGKTDRLSVPHGLITNDWDAAHAMRLCENLKVVHDANLAAPGGDTPYVFWAGELAAEDLRIGLPAVRKAVEAGAALIVTGEDNSLLTLANRADDTARDDVVFEDWESGTYDGWTIEGDAFGEKPAASRLPGGGHLVNTSREGDGLTGRAISRSFQISKRFVHLLLGGGQHSEQVYVSLVVDGKAAATATGDNTERLRAVCWDVSPYLGKEGRIEIVDQRTGEWGIILVDDLVFSDSPDSPFLNVEAAANWRKALPFDWTTRHRADDSIAVDRNSALLTGVPEGEVKTGPCWSFEDLKLKPGARVVLQGADGSPLVIEGTFGQGKILACAGSIHRWMDAAARKAFIGNVVALAAGAAYEPQTGWNETAPFYGSMALAALDTGNEVAVLPQWDDLERLWEDFAADGAFDAAHSATGPSTPGRTWNGAISVPVSLAANEERRVTFVLAWHFPNRMRDHRYGLGPPPPQYDFRLGNQYNNWFGNAAEVVDYIAANRERLEKETRTFHQAFYDSTLPPWLLDAISANLSTLRSPILMWLEDGTVAGFEGADAQGPMNCTHVYNYAMSAAFLFPELERNVRETDLLRQMNPDGHFIPHRTLLPLSFPRLGDENLGPHRHALDGELGTILKTYREWRQCGDRAWLKSLWPNAKLVMQHVLKDHDTDGDGVIKGEQPNTFDVHAYGSNTFIGSLYLATLRATEEMANLLGDREFASVCRERFEKGREGYDRTCWNGEYYLNAYDAPDAAPDTYEQYNCWGKGCLSDQLVGQWWADVLGLGYVLPEEHVRQALDAIYKHNWQRDLSKHQHSQRIFAAGPESGLLNCTWPSGGRPHKPVKYCDEVWTGIEYEVAASLIREGKIAEGLSIAKGARDRYTGNQRNPWSELEYGGHYARAMSSYGLLLAAEGFDFDAASGTLTCVPRLTPEMFKSFFSTGPGWGSLAQQRASNEQKNQVSVVRGPLELKCLTIELPPEAGTAPQFAATVSGSPRLCEAVRKDGRWQLHFEGPVTLNGGEALEVRATWNQHGV
jgi:uncharacterized protein (DUF608 family)